MQKVFSLSLIDYFRCSIQILLKYLPYIMQQLRRKVYNIIEMPRGKHPWGYVFNTTLSVIILMNVLAIILESVPAIQSAYHEELHLFDIFSVSIFTIEYFIRLWIIVEDKKYKHPIKGRLQYMLHPMAIIDFFAILPFYLTMIHIDLRFIKMVRLFRIFRLFKVLRYVAALSFMAEVIKERKEQLVITLIFILFMLLVSSTLMYYVENGQQPEAFSSIPETMWWGVATLTTVGYGDVYPVTALGKVLGGMIAILGIGLFALPTSILASGFSERLDAFTKNKKQKITRCPHCGKEIKKNEIHHE